MTTPLIFVTNDDGIASPGLRAAIEAVHDLGSLVVVAPRTQQTAASRSFPPRKGTVHEQAIRLKDGQTVQAWAVEGTPAQAVRWGLLVQVPRLPDLLISGINYGENVGVNITVSGTIGAAIEGATFGVPGLAVSLEVDPKYHLSHSEEVDFSVAGDFLRRFARLMLRARLPHDVDILKLDVPAGATPTTPWRLTRLSRQRTIHSAVRVKEDGRKYLDGYYRAFDTDALEPDSDVYALAVERVVSITPLSIDLTSRVAPEHLLASLNGEGQELDPRVDGPGHSF